MDFANEYMNVEQNTIGDDMIVAKDGDFGTLELKITDTDVGGNGNV